MPHRRIVQKRIQIVYIFILLLASAIQMIPNSILHLRNFNALLYIAIILIWTLTVDRRIAQNNIRRILRCASQVMVCLFVVRMCRYTFFFHSPLLGEYTWYLYYVPFTVVPLASFLAALCVGKSELEKPLKNAWIFWLAECILSVGILTNRLHGWLIQFTYEGEEIVAVYHNWLYVVVVVWGTLFTFASFVVLMRRCAVSTVREYWYIPVLPALVGTFLLFLYLICGGSPTIHGIKLYMSQEAFCFIYIALFEGCIRIGLIPSNNDYDKLFMDCKLNMVIEDAKGVCVYRSKAYETMKAGRDIRIRTKKIAGGRIIWSENRKVIRELNADIQAAIESIEEENDLIQQENELRAERLHYEAKNRLYDKIAKAVRPQVMMAEGALAERENLQDGMLQASILGAYIKRRGNLELLADENSFISLEELVFAVKESFEYLSLANVSCHVQKEGEKKLPSGLLILTYELFQTILESVYPGIHACMVEIAVTDGFRCVFSVDSEELLLSEKWKKDVCTCLGVVLSVEKEDDFTTITLKEREGVGR